MKTNPYISNKSFLINYYHNFFEVITSARSAKKLFLSISYRPTLLKLNFFVSFLNVIPSTSRTFHLKNRSVIELNWLQYILNMQTPERFLNISIQPQAVALWSLLKGLKTIKVLSHKSKWFSTPDTFGCW